MLGEARNRGSGLKGGGADTCSEWRTVILSVPTSGALAVALFTLLLFGSPAARLRAEEGPRPLEGTAKAPADANQPKKEGPKGEIVNRVVLVVGDVPITSLDFTRMKKELPLLLRNNPFRNEKETGVREELIRRAIVRIEARRESLIVSDARIENEIRRRREAGGFTSEEDFRRELEKRTGMPYELWVRDMPYQLMKRMLIQLKIPVSQPSEEQMQQFYRKNQKQMGMEVAYREIYFQPHNIKEERRLSGVARDIWKEVKGNPSRFAAVASSHPDNRSPLKYRGGYHPFIPLHELATRNNSLAAVLFQLSPGRVGPLFVDKHRRYYIVMLVSRRATPFDKLRPVIRQRLMMEKEEESFQEWIKKREKEVAIIDVAGRNAP